MQENCSEKDTGSVICSFIIRGEHYHNKCFPSLNDLLHEAGRDPRAYNRMKRKYEGIAIDEVRKQLRNYKVECKCRLDYHFGEPIKGQKRDYDNIVSASRKIITDALKKCKVIEDDSPQYLEFGNNYFEYVSEPYIKVEIVKVETPTE